MGKRPPSRFAANSMVSSSQTGPLFFGVNSKSKDLNAENEISSIPKSLPPP